MAPPDHVSHIQQHQALPFSHLQKPYEKYMDKITLLGHTTERSETYSKSQQHRIHLGEYACMQ